jgi:hypothetical protein
MSPRKQKVRARVMYVNSPTGIITQKPEPESSETVFVLAASDVEQAIEQMAKRRWRRDQHKERHWYYRWRDADQGHYRREIMDDLAAIGITAPRKGKAAAS